MLRVLVCDDEPDQIERFVARQSPNFEVVAVGSDPAVVMATLDDAGAQGFDLVVADLYRAKGEIGSSEANENNRVVNDQLAVVDREIAKLRSLVENHKRPTGLEIFHLVRSSLRHGRTPVAITTRQGLSLLRDGQLKEVYDRNGDFILKGREADYEASRMMNLVQAFQARRRRVYRDVVLMLTGVVMSVAVSTIVG